MDRTQLRSYTYWSFMILTVLIALVFRTYALANVPPGMQHDEMFNIRDALRLRPGYLPVFFPDNYGREPLWMYLLAGALQLFGVGTWSARLPAAVIGTLTVILTGVLSYRFYGRSVGLLAAAFMAVSFWPLFMSRVSLRAVLLPFVQGLAVYTLSRALQQSHVRWAVAAGIGIGLLPYTYSIPGQYFPVVLLAWGWLFVVWPGRNRARVWKRMAGISILAVLVALPLAIFALRHPDVVYQRVGVLGYELNQLLAGNIYPALHSTKAVLGMFTHTGDPTWRYNFAGRPVFNPGAGGLFYLGLIVSLIQIRGPEGLLWPTWLLTMLLPSMLTGSAPSFWRASGALIPVFVMPAVGADWIWKQSLRILGKPGGILVILLMGALLGGTAVDTWNDYFQVWAHHPEVCDIYEAGIAAAARFLNQYHDQTTPVWISHQYAWDLGRLVFEFQSTYPGPVRWFNGQFGTIWPSPAHGRDVLIVFTNSAPPLPEVAQILEPYLVYTESVRCGTPYLWVYHLPREALESPPWDIVHPAVGRFADGIEVLGYTSPDQAYRGEKVAFTLYWRVPSEHRYSFSDPPWTAVCLKDDVTGHCWASLSHYPAYPLQDWTPGDSFAETFVLSVPEDMPPLPVTFRVIQHTSRHEIRFVWPHLAGVPLEVGSLRAVGRSIRPVQRDAALSSDDLLLLAADLASSTATGGDSLEISLLWQAVVTPTDHYRIHFWWSPALAPENILGSFEDAIWADIYPPTRWAPGEVVRSFHQVPVPTHLSDGKYSLCLEVLRSDEHLVVNAPVCRGPVEIASRPHSFELPAPQFPLEARFGDAIRLLGYDLRVSDPLPGGQIEITLYWQAIERISENYTVFVHLYTPDQTAILAQHDGPPAGGTAPTSTWLPGEVVADTHVLYVGPDAQSGSAPLGVGMYLLETGERLPVSGDGADPEARRILLGTVRVKP